MVPALNQGARQCADGAAGVAEAAEAIGAALRARRPEPAQPAQQHGRARTRPRSATARGAPQRAIAAEIRWVVRNKTMSHLRVCRCRCRDGTWAVHVGGVAAVPVCLDAVSMIVLTTKQ
jgi:hypothetical protein